VEYEKVKSDSSEKGNDNGKSEEEMKMETRRERDEREENPDGSLLSK
jgi:hypothetical protein